MFDFFVFPMGFRMGTQNCTYEFYNFRYCNRSWSGSSSLEEPLEELLPLALPLLLLELFFCFLDTSLRLELELELDDELLVEGARADRSRVGPPPDSSAWS